MKLKNLLLLPILALLAGVNINNYSKTPVAVNADTFEYEDGTRYGFSADIAQGQETPFVDKGINFAPLNEYSLFWSRDAKITPSGEYSLIANGAYNTEIKTYGNLLLEFKNPINVSEFRVMYLKGLFNTGTMPGTNLTLTAHNYYTCSDGNLSAAIDTVNFGLWTEIENKMSLAPYADSNGLVSKIVFHITSALASGDYLVTFSSFMLEGSPYDYEVDYDFSSRYGYNQPAPFTYKGFDFAPLNEYSTFWSNDAKVTPLGTVSLTRSDSFNDRDLLLLHFKEPIDTTKYEEIRIRGLFYAPGEGDVQTVNLDVYNYYNIEEGNLGEIVGNGVVTHWSVKEFRLDLTKLKDTDGFVSHIVFKINLAEEQILESINILSFSGFTLTDTLNANIDFVSEASASKTCKKKEIKSNLNLIKYNGVALDDPSMEGSKAYKYTKDGKWAVNVKIPLTNDIVVNKDYGYVGNYLTIEEGFEFDDGVSQPETLEVHHHAFEDLYTYPNETTVDDLQPLGLTDLSVNVDRYGDVNIMFSFNAPIAASTYYQATCGESARELAGDAIFYDGAKTSAFILGGYKSSLLDNITLCGLTIDQWYYIEKTEYAAISQVLMFNFGSQLDASLSVNKSCPGIKDRVLASYDANELTIGFKEGLRFSTGRGIKKDVEYTFVDGTARLVNKASAFGVYYSGVALTDNSTIEVTHIPSIDEIYVTGLNGYTVNQTVVSENVEAGTKLVKYEILDGEAVVFTFTVNGTHVAAPKDNSGAGLAIGLSVGGAVLVAGVAVAIILVLRRRKHA